jgi:hypothetical protein
MSGVLTPGVFRPNLVLLRSRSTGYGIHRPRQRSPVQAVLVALRPLSAGDVEPTPGRTKTINQLIKLGCLNCRSVVVKIALIHDLIAERNVDVLALSGTWITSDTPSSILADVAPVGYTVPHQPRQLVQGGPTHGGGLTVVYRDSIVSRRQVHAINF